MRASLILVLALSAACSRDRAKSDLPPATPAPPVAAGPVALRPDERPKVVVLGDSLTAGLGLAQSEAYPALVEQKLRAAGYDWDVVNAGVSGDTSAAGLARADWALDQPNVRILVLELGANDGLRGLPVEEMKKNLGAIIERAQGRHVAVLLAGMEAPPNFGPDYTVSFRQAYRDLAKEYKVALLPFLLDNVAGNSGLNQGDGIHPNVDGARIVADNVWMVLKPMVASLSGGLRPPEPPYAVARGGGIYSIGGDPCTPPGVLRYARSSQLAPLRPHPAPPCPAVARSAKADPAARSLRSLAPAR